MFYLLLGFTMPLRIACYLGVSEPRLLHVRATLVGKGEDGPVEDRMRQVGAA